jgi:dinuclear metal center YbgI/SA1388 family protein
MGCIESIFTISGYLSSLLDVTSFDDVLYNGLLIEGNRPVRKVLVAVTASLAAIEAAVVQDADVLLVHHGFFGKNTPSSLKGFMRARVALLLEQGIHVLAYHLPLDAHKEFGNAWPVGLQLLQNCVPFGSVGNRKIGVMGELNCPMAAQEWYERLQSFWGDKGIYVGNDPAQLIKTCAFVSGGGHRFLTESCDKSVDCFMTGTCDESTWHIAREENVHYMAFGHFRTERLGVQLLGKHVADRFGLSYSFFDEPNPF